MKHTHLGQEGEQPKQGTESHRQDVRLFLAGSQSEQAQWTMGLGSPSLISLASMAGDRYRGRGG